MSKRLFFTFKNYKPFDIAVFLSINMLVGVVVWKPFFMDEYNKVKEIKPQSDEIKSIKDE